MNKNNIFRFIIIIGLICSLTLNGILYGQIGEHKDIEKTLGSLLDDQKRVTNAIQKDYTNLQKQMSDKDLFIKQYSKADNYIMIGDSAWLASVDNFENDFIYDSKDQTLEAIEYYKLSLGIFNELYSQTNDDEIKKEIERKIEYIDSGIKYFENDVESVNYYILSSENYDDYTLRNRYYDKSIDSYDNGLPLYDNWNDAYIHMIDESGIIVEW